MIYLIRYLDLTRVLTSEFIKLGIYDDLAILITVYEDYTSVDSSLVFDVADLFFEKIHDKSVPKLELSLIHI